MSFSEAVAEIIRNSNQPWPEDVNGNPHVIYGLPDGAGWVCYAVPDRRKAYFWGANHWKAMVLDQLRHSGYRYGARPGSYTKNSGSGVLISLETAKTELFFDSNADLSTPKAAEKSVSDLYSEFGCSVEMTNSYKDQVEIGDLIVRWPRGMIQNVEVKWRRLDATYKNVFAQIGETNVGGHSE